MFISPYIEPFLCHRYLDEIGRNNLRYKETAMRSSGTNNGS
jgi:hypothetical protein